MYLAMLSSKSAGKVQLKRGSALKRFPLEKEFYAYSVHVKHS